MTYFYTSGIINKGEKPLKILGILTSCSCVEVKSAKKHML
ncbi:MAG TPA: hypothetical protein DCE82_08895 [Odoribacter splanchnicus]|nr:hypothetical protein [Odoribacter splanchnicus]